MTVFQRETLEQAYAGAERPELEYVGFWPRTGAALIDTVLLMLVLSPLGYAVQGHSGDMTTWAWHLSVNGLVQWLLPALLVLVLWWRLQATPGKLAVGARIVDADTGAAPRLSQLLIRYVGYFVSTIPFCLGFLWVGWDRRKQGWHDKLANTVVVRRVGKEAVRFRA